MNKQDIGGYGKRRVKVMAGLACGHKAHAFKQRLVRGVPEGCDHY